MASPGTTTTAALACRQGIVPPYLLRALAQGFDEPVSSAARASLVIDREHRGRRPATVRGLRTAAPRRRRRTGAPGPDRTISDAEGSTTLPGREVRGEGDEPTGDPAADEAYEGLGATWSLFAKVYGRDSLDGEGLPLHASVHYGRDYDNAFWDGERMVFGDGDGRVFGRFTVAVDVIGHELTHGVVELTAGLAYQGQSGALNESIADVFGSLVKQSLLRQDATQADWLIGAGLFRPGIAGDALRSMRAPGTAYDDPALGRDPQPATMADFVSTDDDNGGVHINSGIPNHAFYLAATAMGGAAQDAAGQVWFDVLTGGELAADADFATFARLTVDAAASRFGPRAARTMAVRDAWRAVGVTPRRRARATDDRSGARQRAKAPSPRPTPPPQSPSRQSPSHETPPRQTSSRQPAPAGTLTIRRSGGLAGGGIERAVQLGALPVDQAAQWLSIAESGVLLDLPPAQPAADRFVYRVRWPAAGLDVTTGERQLPPDVLDTVERTLRER